MAYKRKYKFNWLDYLYYMGRGTPGLDVWFYFLLVPRTLPTVLLLLCVYTMLIEQSFNPALMRMSIYAAFALVVIHYCNWLLKKYRFTPQREQAYFRRYPQRKHYKWSLIYWICIGLYLTGGIGGGVLLYYIFK